MCVCREFHFKERAKVLSKLFSFPVLDDTLFIICVLNKQKKNEKEKTRQVSSIRARFVGERKSHFCIP